MSTSTSRRSTTSLRTWRVGVCVTAAAVATALLPATPALAASARLRAADVTVTERDSTGLVAKVPIRLSRPLGRRVVVSYTTVAGTAKARSDFTRTSGRLVVRPGSTRVYVRVPIKGDSTHESLERFRVKIVGATGATVADAVSVITIRDDDPAAATPAPSSPSAPSPCPAGSDGQARYVRTSDLTAVEGWTANRLLKFGVELSSASELPVCLSWSTADGTARAGQDYTASTGTLVFAPGETLKHVGIAVQGDIAAEPDETFTLRLTNPVNATIPYGRATGTIANDDCAGEDEGRTGATDLGDVLGDASSPALSTSGVRICTGDVDWYAFDLTDFGPAVDLTARINLAVGDAPAQTGGDLDLAVYDAAGVLVASSDRTGTDDELAYVKKADTAAVDDTRVFVKVFGYGGNQVNDYLLTVTGAVATSVTPNL